MPIVPFIPNLALHFPIAISSTDRPFHQRSFLVQQLFETPEWQLANRSLNDLERKE